MANNDGRRGYIYHTAVHLYCRKQGIGSALVDTALSALKQNRHRCEKAARLLDRFGTLASLKNVTAAEIVRSQGNL